MAVRKWSVSVDEALASRVEDHVGHRGLSPFVAKAVQNELERELLDDFLAELDVKFGAVPEGVVDEYRTAWPS